MKTLKIILIVFLALLVPAAVNFSYMLVDADHYAMMFYSSILPWGALLAGAEYLGRAYPRQKWSRAVYRGAVVLLAMLSVFYVR